MDAVYNVLGRTHCKEGTGAMQAEILPNVTAGETITQLLSLNLESRTRVIEQISLQKAKLSQKD